MGGKSGDVNKKGEVGRREIFWGREEAKKINNFGQGRMCFWFIPKTTSMASSSIGALVFIGSLQPMPPATNAPFGRFVH